MYTTRMSQVVQAPPSTVYAALTDAEAIRRWRIPAGMTSEVHEFEAAVDGYYRISLTYDLPGATTGKSSTRTDTYHGHFRSLVPNERVVEEFEFETDDPAFSGMMTMTTSLTELEGGTDVLIVHDGIPDGVSRADNELGTRMALETLAGFVQTRGR